MNRTNRPNLDWLDPIAGEVPVTLRPADETDDRSLWLLADLDSRPLPPAPLLLAERAGTIDAAISVDTAGVVANPFRRTAELVALLRAYAGNVPLGPEEGQASGQRRSRPAVRAKLVTT